MCTCLEKSLCISAFFHFLVCFAPHASPRCLTQMPYAQLHPRCPRAARDSDLQRSARAKLRRQGHLSGLRVRGRPVYQKANKLSRSGLWKRMRKADLRDNAIRHIIVAAGTGRVGSTCLAANLQAQQWDVSHEAGNPGSIDRRSGFKDYFNVYRKPLVKVWAIADKMMAAMKENPRCQPVVGDVSWSNMPFLKHFLMADKRVEVVVQTRDHKSFAKSHMTHHPRVALWETVLLRDRDITAQRIPLRAARLECWSELVLREAHDLKRTFRNRVHIVCLKDLDTFGEKLLRRYGGSVPWDSNRGRNPSGKSRHELRKRPR